jgi:uncharacterized protein (TIGR02001 family)
MNKVVTLAGLASLAIAGWAPVTAYADDGLAFNVGAVSDYRYRGISQSRLKPALQGGLDFAKGPFYVGAWASTIKWVKDAGGDSDVELDVYGGYKGEITKDLTFDVGVLTYVYPSNKLATSANTTEVYGALSFGPATLKYSHSVTNLFGFTDSKNSGYFDLSATFDVAGFGVAPHLGYQRVDGYSDYSYVDYSLTVSKEVVKGLTLSGALVGADTKKIAGTPAYYYAPKDKDLGKAGAVLGLKYAF